MKTNFVVKGESGSKERHILNSIRAKVVVGFLIFGVAMAVSWLVVQFTVNEMILTIDRLSVPNYKLQLADDLFADIVKLEQARKTRAIENPELSREQLLAGSDDLRLKLDSLSHLLADSPRQLDRIQSMNRLLKEYDDLFVQFVSFRKELNENRSLAEKVDEMSSLLSNEKKQDSSVVKTIRKVTTTTIYPDSEEFGNKQRELSIFERLQIRKEKKEPEVIPQPERIVRREEDISIDTVASPQQGSVLNKAVHMMGELKKDQQIRNLRLTQEEYALLNRNADIIRSLLEVSHAIQEEEIARDKETNQAKAAVLQNGIRKYSMLTFGFFLAFGLLVFLIFFDISKSVHYRRQLELAKEKAERLNKIKQRFLANMTHEIRTPLQSIIGFSEQMINYPHQNWDKAAQAIYHSSHHLFQVVNEVLDYNKLESNKFVLDNHPFDMRQALEEVIEVASQQCGEKNIGFQAKVDYESIEGRFFMGDAFRLKQILYNLLGNAVKFTDEGQVSFEVNTENGSSGSLFTFFVNDSGIGISNTDKSRIFEQFEQLHQDGAPRDGIGLGLSIAKALVQAKKGSLNVSSNPGSGSTFTVSVFYDYAEKPPAGWNHQAVRQSDLARGERKQVIMVDDDHFIRELCKVIFDRHRINFCSFPSGEDLISSEWINFSGELIFLLDVRLPGISGPELAPRIRQIFGEKVYLVAVTAQAPDDDIRRLKEAGFNDILLKPFNENELLSAVWRGTPDQNHTKLNGERDQPDLTNLVKMAGNDQELIEAFIEDFVSDSHKDIETIKSAMARRETKEIAEMIHRLAGRCGHVGAFRLATDFRKLEQVIREDPSTLKIHHRSIHHVLSRLEKLNNDFSDEKKV